MLSSNPRRWARSAWNRGARKWLYDYTGVRWDSTKATWLLDSAWRYSNGQVATQAYYAEYALRPAVQLAAITADVPLEDEIARFYLAYRPRFATLGAWRRQLSGVAGDTVLERQGGDRASTLIDVDRRGPATRVRECVTCTLQFLHPAARLIRVIGQLPDSERTGAMRRFVAEYLPLIADDQVLRLVYDVRWTYWGRRDMPERLLGVWHVLRESPAPSGHRYQHAMLDSDVWMIAIAAELISARRADSALVRLDPHETSRLRTVVDSGLALLRSKRHSHPETLNFSGQRVGSVSYFDGDFADHPDLAFAAITDDSLPNPIRPHPGSPSWDISHAYRIAVLFRSLLDNRESLGNPKPTADAPLVINQYVYRVFNGDWTHPRFANFFDGSDGWYRVDLVARRGIPPSTACDTRKADRPCLTLGAVFAWGMLADLSPDLAKLQHALISLALASSPDQIAFRERYYTYGGERFAACDPLGHDAYPFLLFSVVASAVTVEP